jgi:hypothetical protein
MVTFPDVPLGIFLFCVCVIAIGAVQVGQGTCGGRVTIGHADGVPVSRPSHPAYEHTWDLAHPDPAPC